MHPTTPQDPLAPENRPAIARRALAWAVDFALVLAAAYAIGVYTVHQITDVWDNAPQLGVSTWQLITGDGDAIDRAGQFATSLWHQVVTAVIQGFLLLAATTFAYHWACLTFTGRTLGKALLGVRLTPHTPGRTAARAAVTTLADVGCFAFACCLLISGHPVWSVIAWLGSVAVFWFNALSAYSGRTVADRIAGTTVVNATYTAPAPQPQFQPPAQPAFQTPAPPYAAPTPGPYTPAPTQQTPPPYAPPMPQHQPAPAPQPVRTP
ncbi:hypothetical protein ACFV98_22550 [Streptomyces violascens]|uniref:hypothetical protein n=1 Tax=Streptomyces violascens TaxID=67381 RepID=UPI00365F71F3